MIAHAVPACTAADIRPLGGNLSGATGTMDGFVAFRNRSATACRLGRVATAQITTRSGTVLRTVSRRMHVPNAIAIAPPGRRVALPLDWSNWCGAWRGSATHLRTLRLHIRLTTGLRIVTSFTTGRPRCDRKSAPSILFVGTFARNI